jgi:hypothetical protein
MPCAKTYARMRPVSAEGSKADMRSGFHNDRAAKIAVIKFKPAEFKVKLESSMALGFAGNGFNRPEA